jgi:hypothetical protein
MQSGPGPSALGRPRTVHAIRALVLRLVRENPPSGGIGDCTVNRPHVERLAQVGDLGMGLLEGMFDAGAFVRGIQRERGMSREDERGVAGGAVQSVRFAGVDVKRAGER